MTLTKEQLIERCKSQADYAQAIIDLYPDDVGAAESRRIAEIALAALAGMEAEPVAYMTYKGYLLHASDPKVAEYSEPMPLYDAPQPLTIFERAELENYRNAQAALKDHQFRELVTELRDIAVDYHGTQQLREHIARALRAATLQGKAEPVTTDCKLPDDFDFDRFNDVVWLEAVASNPHMHSLTTSTIAMVALELNRKLADGNSPVIPDGWVACSEANSALVMLDRIETTDPADDDRIDDVKRIIRELSQSRKDPQCWCRICRPVTLTDMRFVVCPCCGNKRCPRANDHRNKCSGSNEPGQEGSAYPSAPQQEVKS